MPAYFSIICECDQSKLYDNLLMDFYSVFQSVGAVFISGYYDSFGESFEAILDRNQRLLKENHIPDIKSDISEHYSQLLFDYEGFSETRSFLINHSNDASFSIHIVIPEDELLTFDKGKITYSPQKIDKLTHLSTKLWELYFVEIIQTTLELSDSASHLSGIKNGALPSVEPFAIIPSSIGKHVNYPVMKTLNTTKEGILLSQLIS